MYPQKVHLIDSHDPRKKVNKIKIQRLFTWRKSLLLTASDSALIFPSFFIIKKPQQDCYANWVMLILKSTCAKYLIKVPFFNILLFLWEFFWGVGVGGIIFSSLLSSLFFLVRIGWRLFCCLCNFLLMLLFFIAVVFRGRHSV